MPRTHRFLVALLLVASASACGNGDGGSVDTGAEPSPPDTAAAAVTTTVTTPATTAVFPGIWPFASQDEADGYAGGDDTLFRNAVDTAREFAHRYVGMVGAVPVGPATPAGNLVEVKVGIGTGEGGRPVADPKPTMTVRLQNVGDGDGDRSPWTVVGAVSEQIVVDTPEPLNRISSPVALSGRAQAYEGTVAVEVREDGMLAGESLGAGFVTGGGDAVRPFGGRVPFRPPGKPAGAVVFYEPSAADGQGALRATVVRVRLT